ncbi:MAG TPA: hypothetical protein VLA16_16800 [Ideonella sp.]|nr:hypothetical protein [Ideonella sp.]
MSFFSSKSFRRPLLAVAAILAAGAAQAQSNPWTSVGSAGVVDDADTGIVDFVAGEARMRSTAVVGAMLNLRYNVVSLPGFSGPGQYVMRTRFRDNGAGANVRLDLRRYQTNGLNSVQATFDSDDYPASAIYQTQGECVLVDWDFDTSAYYIEATLHKGAAAGTPALGLIQLVPGNCVP